MTKVKNITLQLRGVKIKHQNTRYIIDFRYALPSQISSAKDVMTISDVDSEIVANVSSILMDYSSPTLHFYDDEITLYWTFWYPLSGNKVIKSDDLIKHLSSVIDMSKAVHEQ